MNTELKEALEILGKERNIPKEALLEAIESSLLTACKNHFGKADNCSVSIDRDTYEYRIIQTKTVVEKVEDPVEEISLPDALMINKNVQLGDTVDIPIDSQKFGRIATQNAKGVIVQKIREEERNSLYRDFYEHEHGIMTGVVQRNLGRNISINLGKADAILAENEQIRGENLKPNQRIRVYLLEVKNNPRGPRISVSRTHPDLVKCLFAEEVSEIKEGVVEVMAIAREAGSRTKMAVVSHDENVDPVGACVGVNGTRVNSIVDELGGEKIDIINWDENPAFLIENALSPAKVICVVADEDSREAVVIVPDYQLSLAIGKEGQNARLAAKLTGYKIDIKSETQAEESGLLEELGMQLSEEGEYTEEGYYEDEYVPEEEGDVVYEDDGEFAEDGFVEDGAVEE
ncbi:MAG: transcription termination/antitermination protein NusA [Lachnospiraceae bacterium]|nr:transcription termination/antitermination protein NusA [Lachnospiraceae bacterium]